MTAAHHRGIILAQQHAQPQAAGSPTSGLPNSRCHCAAPHVELHILIVRGQLAHDKIGGLQHVTCRHEIPSTWGKKEAWPHHQAETPGHCMPRLVINNVLPAEHEAQHVGSTDGTMSTSW